MESATGLTDFLRQATEQTDSTSLNPGIADLCYKQLEANYDPKYGGFGGGPKFPRPVVFSFLLRHYIRTGNEKALLMVETTLKEMSKGGISDHLGGGFHRYSVDAEWRVPHFEKMLYDQAQLACSYLELYQVTGNNEYAAIAKEILGYVQRDLTDKEGGFYSAEDADSQDPAHPEKKTEGAFYLWTEQELRQLLSPDDFVVFSKYYGIETAGNAPADPQGEFEGRNIPYVALSMEELSSATGHDKAGLTERLIRIRKLLLDQRAKRRRPHLDDKILTSWNGMMISTFARAHQILGDEQYLVIAENAARFIVEELFQQDDEVLLRRYRDGDGGLEAHLDDYAFLSQGLLDLYEASFDVDWLDWSVRLTQRMVDIFHDSERGGFFDTSGKDSSILIRTKESYDGAEPAGNSVAVAVLLRLADMTDNEHWRSMAAEALTTASHFLNQQPSVMPQMVVALDMMQNKPKQIILVGGRNEGGTARFLSTVHQRLLPGRMLMLVEGEGPDVPIARFLPFAGKLSRVAGKPTAYVCEDYVCRLPTNDPVVLEKLLVLKSSMDN